MDKNDFLERYGPAALVTGASAGIGKSFAESLAAMGMDLVLVARRKAELDAVATAIANTHGVRITALPVDLSAPTAPQQIAAATATIDIGLIVSNAGYGMKGEHAGHDAAALTAMLMVNCNAPLLLAHAFAPRLKQRGKGGMIFTSSVEGLMGVPYSTAYAASKALVNSLGEGLWGELTPHGVDVLTLLPGATATDALRRAGLDPATMPNVMSPDDVARLALENIQNGPTYIPSEHYRAMFQHMLSLPRREALALMAASMRK
jgi:short-subunit dehydrogenase